MDMVIVSTAPEDFLEMEIIPNCVTLKDAKNRRTLKSPIGYFSYKNFLIELLEEKLKYLKGPEENKEYARGKCPICGADAIFKINERI